MLRPILAAQEHVKRAVGGKAYVTQYLTPGTAGRVPLVLLTVSGATTIRLRSIPGRRRRLSAIPTDPATNTSVRDMTACQSSTPRESITRSSSWTAVTIR